MLLSIPTLEEFYVCLYKTIPNAVIQQILLNVQMVNLKKMIPWQSEAIWSSSLDGPNPESDHRVVPTY